MEMDVTHLAENHVFGFWYRFRLVRQVDDEFGGLHYSGSAMSIGVRTVQHMGVDY